MARNETVILVRTLSFLLCVSLASAASAQIPDLPFGRPPATTPAAPAAPAVPAVPKNVTETTISDRREGFNDQKDWHFVGHVEMDQGGDTKIYAEDVWTYIGEDRAVASGNVVFAQGNNRISAERAEFNLQTRLGMFYNAWGMASVKPQAETPRPGQVSAPTLAGQENVVLFFGETIEKIGPKKYKITNGGFTCLRCNVHGGASGIRLGDDTNVVDSFVHDECCDSTIHKTAVSGHGGVRDQVVHSTMDCAVQGCSAAFSLYGDFGPLDDVLVQNNLFNTTGSYCTYGGSTPAKPYPHATNIRYIDNRFGRKYTTKCGQYAGNNRKRRRGRISLVPRATSRR